MTTWFDGTVVPPLTSPGTAAERAKARLAAASMILRQGLGATELKLVIDALDLWPAADPR